MLSNQNLPLFWYSLYKFNPSPPIFSRHWLRKVTDQEKENYGDLLSKYLYYKIKGVKPKWYNPIRDPAKPHFLAVGSVLNFANPQSIVWGSGVINSSHKLSDSDYRAVRGPLTRKRILESGFNCPEIYGDPCLLLPEFYNPEIEKKFELGIIPHFCDLKIVKSLIKNSSIKIIELLTNDIEKTTREILECHNIISSSLHGIIAAHAYGIPAVWVKFSNNLFGDGIKFKDYFASVRLNEYMGEFWTGQGGIEELKRICNKYPNLPEQDVIDELKNNLLANCPY